MLKMICQLIHSYVEKLHFPKLLSTVSMMPALRYLLSPCYAVMQIPEVCSSCFCWSLLLVQLGTQIGTCLG